MSCATADVWTTALYCSMSSAKRCPTPERQIKMKTLQLIIRDLPDSDYLPTCVQPQHMWGHDRWYHLCHVNQLAVMRSAERSLENVWLMQIDGCICQYVSRSLQWRKDCAFLSSISDDVWKLLEMWQTFIMVLNTQCCVCNIWLARLSSSSVVCNLVWEYWSHQNAISVWF